MSQFALNQDKLEPSVPSIGAEFDVSQGHGTMKDHWYAATKATSESRTLWSYLHQDGMLRERCCPDITTENTGWWKTSQEAVDAVLAVHGIPTIVERF